MRVVPIVLVLLLVTVPGATAQVPTQPCGPLAIPNAPAVPAQAVGAGETADLTVEVVNSGPRSANVEVAAVTNTPGWTIVSTPPPADVAAGATGSFAFTLRAGDAASDDATISFTASGTCASPLPTCPGDLCNAQSASATAQVPFRPAEGFNIPGLENLDFPVEYLIAAIVLVGLATAIPFAMRKKKPGIVADCPEPLKMVRAGRGTSFPIEIRNPSKESSTAAFEVGPVPEGWSAFMPLPEVQLAAREARSLWLMVRSPQTANVGDAVEVELRLRDPHRAGNGSVVRVRAEVQAGAEA